MDLRVDEGETSQEAALRKVEEETGLTTKVKRLIGVRDGIMAHRKKMNMGYISYFRW